MKSNISYITQMTGTTKFLYKNCSHSQKHKIQIFERPPPSNSPEIVLHTFRHSTLTVPQFQEDPGFWSAEQLEPDKSMSKVQGKLKSQAWPPKWIRGVPRPHLPRYGLTARSEPVCRSLDRASHCDTGTSRSFPLASITKRLQVSYPINWSFCYFQVFLLHTQKKR